ncbi:MAG: MerR family transcriptional regulator [Thermoleophilia bacterium]
MTAVRPIGDETVRIGEAARLTGLTPRTLRYYEEIGLLSPAPEGAGATRQYTAADIDRLERIRELQDLLSLPLVEIRAVLEAEDATEALRARYRADDSPASQLQVVREAIEVNARMLERVDARLGRIEAFRAQLATKMERRRAREAELARAVEEAGGGG